MTEQEETNRKTSPETPTNWKQVYFLVLAFLMAFCIFMYIFTKYTSK